jgi:hypothetical protein
MKSYFLTTTASCITTERWRITVPDDFDGDVGDAFLDNDERVQVEFLYEETSDEEDRDIVSISDDEWLPHLPEEDDE